MLNEPRRKFHQSFLACFFLLCPMVGRVQVPTEQDVPSLRTQSNVVFVPALVKDHAGKLIFGLQASDFIIEDDGVEQQVSMDEAEPAGSGLAGHCDPERAYRRCLNFSA